MGHDVMSTLRPAPCFACYNITVLCGGVVTTPLQYNKKYKNFPPPPPPPPPQPTRKYSLTQVVGELEGNYTEDVQLVEGGACQLPTSSLEMRPPASTSWWTQFEPAEVSVRLRPEALFKVCLPYQ